MKNIPLIGADPEVFVGFGRNPASAIGFVGGTKDEPIPVEGGALQEDNVLLEYNIHPASSFEQFHHGITSVLNIGRETIRPFGLEVIDNLSSHLYEEDVLRGFGDAAFVFGCEPDYNAWTRSRNRMPTDAPPTLRTAGGHIHIGFAEDLPVTKANCRAVIQACDIYLGLASVLIDGDTDRKLLYGKAGACRYKPYGVEYRTLSNFWIFSDELIKWAYDSALKAYSVVVEGGLDDAIAAVGGAAEVQRIINENDAVAAMAALEKLGVAHE
ncbi:hypothetical protein [Pseudomonas phage PhL_UNISO_PA-DSM_ph0041x]|nr:hypothetical protein [Pseudomonas phage PhL_UNISO_PA-DSM_ph0041x]